MAKFRTNQNNFIFGEVSPKISARSDLEQYFRSAKELRNAIPSAQGTVARRPGTIFRESNQSSETALRLIPWIVSETDARLISINDSVFWRVLSSDPSVTSLVLNTSLSGTLLDADLPGFQFAQTGTWIALFHKDHAPIYIEPSGVAPGGDMTSINFAPGTINPIPNQGTAAAAIINKNQAERVPYFPTNSDPETLIKLNTTGGVGTTGIATMENASASAVSFFDSSMPRVGDFFNTMFFLPDDTGTYIEVTGFNSASSVNYKVVKGTVTANYTSANGNWAESAWSKSRGWPRSGCFFDTRASHGGTASEPNTFYFSQIGDFFEMDQNIGTATTDAFRKDNTENKVAETQWMQPGQNQITVGTLSDEYIIAPPNAAAAIGVDNIAITKRTSLGSAYVQNRIVNSAPVFVQRSRKRIHEFVFNFNEDNFRSTDLTLLAEHIWNRSRDLHTTFSEPQIKEWDTQQTENTTIWIVDNNGGLVSVTRDRQFNILGYAHHRIGGTLSSEAAKVESVAVIPSADGTYDDVYLVVVRTIESTEVRYIERITRTWGRNDFFNSSTNVLDKPIYLDCAEFVRLGSSGKSFTGFNHLEGESVDVIADGLYVGKHTVSATGVITLLENATEVIAGFSYRSLVQPLAIEDGTVLKSGRHARKRINTIHVELIGSVGLKVGADEDNLDDISFREATQIMNDPIPRFSGVKKIELEGDYDELLLPVLVQDLPFPWEIVAVSFEGNTND